MCSTLRARSPYGCALSTLSIIDSLNWRRLQASALIDAKGLPRGVKKPTAHYIDPIAGKTLLSPNDPEPDRGAQAPAHYRPLERHRKSPQILQFQFANQRQLVNLVRNIPQHLIRAGLRHRFEIRLIVLMPQHVLVVQQRCALSRRLVMPRDTRRQGPRNQ